MDLTYSLKPVLPADVEQRLNEPPPKAVREFLAEPYPEFVDIFNVTEDLALPRELDWQWMPLAAGDCTFHSGCVYHRADANRTSAMREAMTVAYMSADATYAWPEWNSRVEYTHGFGTAGLRRGDPLNKPTTPQLPVLEQVYAQE